MYNKIISENYKQNLSNVINVIPTLFWIINLILTIHLFNENKNINTTIKRIPFEELKKYQQFSNDKQELEILKWKEQSYVNKINENEKEIKDMKNRILNLELKIEDNQIIKNNST